MRTFASPRELNTFTQVKIKSLIFIFEILKIRYTASVGKTEKAETDSNQMCSFIKTHAAAAASHNLVSTFFITKIYILRWPACS